MLGRKDYTRDELDHARAAVERQLASYRKLAGDRRTPTTEAVDPALDELETVLFGNMALALDRHFVHRIRAVAGKDGNPLNEVELIADALMSNEGVLRGNKVISYHPERSVLGLRIGDRISLTADDFERLAGAFLDEIERTFVPPS